MSRYWFEPVDLRRLNALNERDMISRLGLVYTRIEDGLLEAEFEIDERTRQPFGLLHGGVSCAVSESMGSIAANLCVDREKQACVGIDINASHLRGASSGRVRALHAHSRRARHPGLADGSLRRRGPASLRIASDRRRDRCSRKVTYSDRGRGNSAQ